MISHQAVLIVCYTALTDVVGQMHWEEELNTARSRYAVQQDFSGLLCTNDV